MTDRQKFQLQVAAKPEDKLVRLVFSDWLQEGGQVRTAEFIRGMVTRDPGSLKSITPNGTIFISKILQLYGFSGFSKLYGVYRYTVTGGFVTSIKISLDDFYRLGPSIVAQHPIKRISFHDLDPETRFTLDPLQPLGWNRGNESWRPSAFPFQDLPVPLFKRLRGGRAVVPFFRVYKTAKLAVDDLTDAAIDWARSKEQADRIVLEDDPAPRYHFEGVSP